MSDRHRPRMAQPIRSVVANHQLVAFFGLAFLWTWSFHLVVYLVVGPSPGILQRGIVGAWGPLIAAGVVTWAANGDRREWARQVTKWRLPLRLVLPAVVLPFLINGTIAAATIHLLQGGSVTLVPSPWWHYVANFVVVLFLAGALEEFGWRGFAQPRLQERFSALVGAIVVGFAWTLWHLPMFYLYDVPAYDPSGYLTSYLWTLVVQSIVYAWLYNASGGSLLLPMIAHSLSNLPPLVGTVGPVGMPADVVPEILAALVVVGLILGYGIEYLAPSAPSPRIPGMSQRDRSG
ncbi:MAG: CPBP family intramembrane glutamic endopeptidase [Halanaeroarchaeum sp.]